MGFLGSMFSGGNSWQAQGADVTSPLAGGAQAASDQAQTSINQQQALAQALQAQGGIQNQSNIYNQLGGIASGQGPNPAAAMLAQQTGANQAQQAAMQAGQRGGGANAGLLARNAGQIGAGVQQQAVGQGATMQAQQALAALGQQAGIAGQQVGNTIGAQQGVTSAQQGQAGQLIGANVAQNNANIANVSQQNQANAGINSSKVTEQGNIVSGLLGGAGAAAGLAHGGMVPHYDDGGTVAPAASGINDFGSSNGPVSSFGKAMSGTGANGQSSNPFLAPMTSIGSAINKQAKSLFSSAPTPGGTSPDIMGATPTASATPSDTSLPSNVANSTGGAAPLGTESYAKGGKVPAMVSPGEKYLNPTEVEKVERGEKPAIKAGVTIKGKAAVPGDSLKNDNVPKTLEEGGIVLPRSITQSKRPGPAAQKFVEALLAKQGKGKRAA
jgi:hypothetical protein